MLPYTCMASETFNYYDVLEVSPESTQDKIYEAYKLAKETYSLSNPSIFNTFSETEAIEWINIIEEAYSIIGHPNTRRVYDLELQNLFTKDLPSLNLENSAPQVSSPKTVTIPEGFATTAISQYETNKNIEELIKTQELFDGLFLKKIREYKNIDLTDFSKHTCIAIRHLYAIENNNFSVLPAAVFVRGYIIQYCRVLELDQAKVVTSFMSLLKNG